MKSKKIIAFTVAVIIMTAYTFKNMFTHHEYLLAVFAIYTGAYVLYLSFVTNALVSMSDRLALVLFLVSVFGGFVQVSIVVYLICSIL